MSYPGGQNPYDPYSQQPHGESQPYGQSNPYQQPQQPYGQQPYGQYPQQFAGYGVPDHPQATTILILGILSLVVCGLTGPFAWVMGQKALREIDASGGAIGGRGNVMGGYVCGIIGTIGLVLALLFFLVIPLIFGAAILGSL